GPAGGDEGEDFVADTVVESDMELLLPALYVPQESERINLYRELDAMERDEDIERFIGRLTDRFGPVPEVTLELTRVPRLRRLARRLGIEKVALKGGVMYLYFVDDSNEAYYQSAAFGRIISYLQQNPQRVKIRTNPTTGRRSFSIAAVPTVLAAVNILSEIRALPVS
ncbi:MAG: transcription-repair coupling factor, partial [Muribaculaceae bacterium]|nr:transcription-repair coupling factor [Muribaculaceae bacterium]